MFITTNLLVLTSRAVVTLTKKIYRIDRISEIGVSRAMDKADKYYSSMVRLKKMIESDPNNTKAQLVLLDELIKYGKEAHDHSAIAAAKYMEVSGAYRTRD